MRSSPIRRVTGGGRRTGRLKANDTRLIGEERTVTGCASRRRTRGAGPLVRGSTRVGKGVTRLRTTAENAINVVVRVEVSQGVRVFLETSAILLVDGRERTERADRRSFITRLTGVQQTRNGDSSDDGDNGHNNHELDKSKTLLALHRKTSD